MKDPNGSGEGGQVGRLLAEAADAFERAASTTGAARDAAFLEGLDRTNQAELARAYSYLQRAVGVLSVLLPPVLLVGHQLVDDDAHLLGSVSAYYYSGMGNVFVGVLCALAVFFLSYQYRPAFEFQLDSTLSRVAALAAAGVAIFPTLDAKAGASTGEEWVSRVHLTSAFTLLTLLAFLAYFRFTRTGGGDPTPQKLVRNKIYRGCGLVIAVALLVAGLTMVVSEPTWWHAFMWAEIVCIEAFGFSWLVKGGFCGWFADPE
jgi:hypothetical protein